MAKKQSTKSQTEKCRDYAIQIFEKYELSKRTWPSDKEINEIIIESIRSESKDFIIGSVCQRHQFGP